MECLSAGQLTLQDCGKAQHVCNQEPFSSANYSVLAKGFPSLSLLDKGDDIQEGHN